MTNPDLTATAELPSFVNPAQYDSRPAALVEAQAAYTNALTAMGLTLTDLRHFNWKADLLLQREADADDLPIMTIT